MYVKSSQVQVKSCRITILRDCNVGRAHNTLTSAGIMDPSWQDKETSCFKGGKTWWVHPARWSSCIPGNLQRSGLLIHPLRTCGTCACLLRYRQNLAENRDIWCVYEYALDPRFDGQVVPSGKECTFYPVRALLAVKLEWKAIMGECLTIPT